MSPDALSEAAVEGASALMGACPIPITDYREIVLAHGSGGKLSQQLIQKLILPQFANDFLNPLHDGAIFSVNGRGSHSARIPTSLARFSSRAATSERSPFTAQ